MSEDQGKALISAGIIGRIGVIAPSSTPLGPDADKKTKGFAPLLEAELKQEQFKGPNVDRASDLTSSLSMDSWVALAKSGNPDDTVAANAVAALYRFTERAEAAMPQAEDTDGKANPKFDLKT